MSDPTAIGIEFDPTVQRMSGIAVHGNTPFDVPFISEISDNLWQGGCEDGLILPEFVDHLVSLYPWESYDICREVKTQLKVVMYDSTTQDFKQVEEIAQWVANRVLEGPTLVHCQAGLNRSSLVSARALMLIHKCTAEKAIAVIKAKRSEACLCNESFLAWLRRLDDK
jgi:protein-tyrosine phosphatase